MKSTNKIIKSCCLLLLMLYFLHPLNSFSKGKSSTKDRLTSYLHSGVFGSKTDEDKVFGFGKREESRGGEKQKDIEKSKKDKRDDDDDNEDKNKDSNKKDNGSGKQKKTLFTKLFEDAKYENFEEQEDTEVFDEKLLEQ